MVRIDVGQTGVELPSVSVTYAQQTHQASGESSVHLCAKRGITGKEVSAIGSRAMPDDQLNTLYCVSRYGRVLIPYYTVNGVHTTM